jgi:hypothetical protein
MGVRTAEPLGQRRKNAQSQGEGHEGKSGQEVDELRRNPEAVSKKTVAAIQEMGVRPDRGLVAKMAAKVIAYRLRMGTQKGKDTFQDRALNEAVRKQVKNTASK